MFLKNLLETNLYDVYGNVLIYGTCLPIMEENCFNEIKMKYDSIISLCLEKEHINMAITKICGMISTKKIKSITFASVNRSPHCTQMHYIKHEIERIMSKENIPDINNIIIKDNKVYNISNDAILLSKDLIQLSDMV